MGRYLDIAKTVIGESDAHRGYEKNELSELSPPAGVVGGVPVSWDRGVAALLKMDAPLAYPHERWGALRRDAYSFLRTWGAQAHRLGWISADLFAVHCRAPWARVDSMGLIPLLHGRKIMALSSDQAAIKTGSGRTLYYRKPLPYPTECCMVWELSHDRAAHPEATDGCTAVHGRCAVSQYEGWSKD